MLEGREAYASIKVAALSTMLSAPAGVGNHGGRCLRHSSKFGGGPPVSGFEFWIFGFRCPRYLRNPRLPSSRPGRRRLLCPPPNLAGSKHRAAMFPPARARAELLSKPNAPIHSHAGGAGTRRWTAQRAILATQKYFGFISVFYLATRSGL